LGSAFVHGCFVIKGSKANFIAKVRARPTLAQCKCNFVPITTLLHMRGVGLRQRTVQPVFIAVIVDPFPNVALSAFRAGDVDGAALAVTLVRLPPCKELLTPALFRPYQVISYLLISWDRQHSEYRIGSTMPHSLSLSD
jgi:hypothetical protein